LIQSGQEIISCNLGGFVKNIKKLMLVAVGLVGLLATTRSAAAGSTEDGNGKFFFSVNFTGRGSDENAAANDLAQNIANSGVEGDCYSYSDSAQLDYGPIIYFANLTRQPEPTSISAIENVSCR
jgi:hypothetical protein